MSRTFLTRRYALAAAAIAVLLPLANSAADVAPEHAIKAAIVHKITKFVSWPDGALGDSESPIRFCVAGDRDTYDALKIFEAHPVQGRPVLVAAVSEPEDVTRRCDVLYLADAGVASPDVWLAKIATQPILTIGESAGASIVKITIRRKKVRFAINLEACELAGLNVGAQLLQLAALSDRRGN